MSSDENIQIRHQTRTQAEMALTPQNAEDFGTVGFDIADKGQRSEEREQASGSPSERRESKR
jgi:hypothetical protein